MVAVCDVLTVHVHLAGLGLVVSYVRQVHTYRQQGMAEVVRTG